MHLSVQLFGAFFWRGGAFILAGRPNKCTTDPLAGALLASFSTTGPLSHFEAMSTRCDRGALSLWLAQPLFSARAHTSASAMSARAHTCARRRGAGDRAGPGRGGGKGAGQGTATDLAGGRVGRCPRNLVFGKQRSQSFVVASFRFACLALCIWLARWVA